MPQRTNGWYWLAFALFAIVLAAYAKRYDLADLYVGFRHSEQEVTNLEARLQSLKAEKKALDSSVSGLDNDPLEMETAIRGSKGLVREGETVYRVELPEDSAP